MIWIFLANNLVFCQRGYNYWKFYCNINNVIYFHYNNDIRSITWKADIGGKQCKLKNVSNAILIMSVNKYIGLVKKLKRSSNSKCMIFFISRLDDWQVARNVEDGHWWNKEHVRESELHYYSSMYKPTFQDSLE